MCTQYVYMDSIMFAQDNGFHSHRLRASNEDTFTASSPLLSQLSRLSKIPSWLLFTAEATLPTLPELQAYGIDSRKVIKIKPSSSLNEKQIILKAISLKNASGIVASDNFDQDEKAELINMAKQADCKIFFMSHTTRRALARHVH